MRFKTNALNTQTPSDVKVRFKRWISPRCCPAIIPHKHRDKHTHDNASTDSRAIAVKFVGIIYMCKKIAAPITDRHCGSRRFLAHVPLLDALACTSTQGRGVEASKVSALFALARSGSSPIQPLQHLLDSTEVP
jgi:hypothetical protein